MITHRFISRLRGNRSEVMHFLHNSDHIFDCQQLLAGTISGPTAKLILLQFSEVSNPFEGIFDLGNTLIVTLNRSGQSSPCLEQRTAYRLDLRSIFKHDLVFVVDIAELLFRDVHPRPRDEEHLYVVSCSPDSARGNHTLPSCNSS